MQPVFVITIADIVGLSVLGLCLAVFLLLLALGWAQKMWGRWK